MKFTPEVLVEIMSILQQGLLEGKDISEALRELDLVSIATPHQPDVFLTLSREYIDSHPRGGARE